MAYSMILKSVGCDLSARLSSGRETPLYRMPCTVFTFKVKQEPRCQSTNHFALSPPQLLWEALMRRIFSITSYIGCHPRLRKSLFYNPGLIWTQPQYKRLRKLYFHPNPISMPGQAKGESALLRNCCYCQKRTLVQWGAFQWAKKTTSAFNTNDWDRSKI